MLALLRALPYLAIVALIGLVLWFRGEAVKADGERDLAVTHKQIAEQSLKDAVAVNERQDKTIEALTKLRDSNDALLTALNLSLQEISGKTDLTRSDIRQLEKSNAAVRNYLDTPVPPDLGRVLNGEPAASGGSH